MSYTKTLLDDIEEQAQYLSQAELIAKFPYTGVAELWDEVNGPQQIELPSTHAPFNGANQVVTDEDVPF